MDNTLWATADDHFGGLPGLPNPALGTNAAMGLPPHDVSPLQGRLLMLLAQVHGARRILEIGTLGGYSRMWLARAGLAAAVDLRMERALDTLPHLAMDGEDPFDRTFIDADKMLAAEPRGACDGRSAG